MNKEDKIDESVDWSLNLYNQLKYSFFTPIKQLICKQICFQKL